MRSYGNFTGKLKNGVVCPKCSKGPTDLVSADKLNRPHSGKKCSEMRKKLKRDWDAAQATKMEAAASSTNTASRRG